jgi:glyoxylase-like metal-dependent hydrolase (beta-lactamase superfamily II)
MLRHLALALLLASPALAQTGPQPVAPAIAPLKIGKIDAAVLRDAGFVAANDGKTFGIGEGVPAVAAVLEAAGAPGDRIQLGVGGLLVRTQGHVSIIDTGLGPGADGKLLASLGVAGFKPADVTDIFISHSHFDHVGGLLTADGKSAFPKAAIRMHALEWAFLKSNPANAKLVAAIGPQVKTFDTAGTLIPGIAALPNPGHTPGHSTYRVGTLPNSLRTLGDTAHSHIISLAKPGWAVAFDTDKAGGEAARRALLAELAKTHERVWAPHFPWPSVGTVVVKGDGYAWVPDAGVVGK